jgi:hypothetical protein
MKAISLYEPWATLIALGEKRYETRSWSTTYRGSLLICASKIRLPTVKIIDLMVRARITVNDLNPGRAVTLVDLIHIYRTDDLHYGQLGENEEFYGNLFPGRFAWQLKNIRRFVNPPLVRGRQGLFDVDDNLIKSLDTFNPI